MATVGEQLHTARTAQQLTLHQVGETTKIRTDYLEALEAGDYNRFVAPVYIRGFVRTYAKLLRLELPPLMSALDGELGQSPKFREDPSLAPPRRGLLDMLLYQVSRINWARTGVGLLLLVLLGGTAWAVSAWRTAARKDPLAGVQAPVYQAPSNPPGGEVLPLPPLPRRP
jgi:cytoskeleton protein RodZ